MDQTELQRAIEAILFAAGESVEISRLAMALETDEKEIRNCHINIGTGKEIRIADLAHLIQKTVGYQGEIHFDATKPDGTRRKLTDVSKLHRLGWHHRIEIEEGVNLLYKWYLSHIH